VPQCSKRFWDPFQAIHGFFRRWCILVFLFSHFIRIGEAAVPGPTEDSFLSHPSWTTPSMPDFCIGVGNPGGIANKHHMFSSIFLWGGGISRKRKLLKLNSVAFKKVCVHLPFVKIAFSEVVWATQLPFDPTQLQQGHGRGS